MNFIQRENCIKMSIVFYQFFWSICRQRLKNSFLVKTVLIGWSPALLKLNGCWLLVACLLLNLWILMAASRCGLKIGLNSVRIGKWKTFISFCKSFCYSLWTCCIVCRRFWSRAFGKQRASPIRKIKILKSIIRFRLKRLLSDCSFPYENLDAPKRNFFLKNRLLSKTNPQ